MSASLVGSEMCIRDSATKASATEHAKVPATVVVLVLALSYAALAVVWQTCLLYTSDAADDM
eukprot:1649931-Alexandrium_andersonii.AAC.1